MAAMPKRGRSVLFMARRLLSGKGSWERVHSTRPGGLALSDNALHVGRTGPCCVKDGVTFYEVATRTPSFKGLRGAQRSKESRAMDDSDPAAKVSRDVLRALASRRIGLAAAA